jgi:asparagine synthase (glutamine-hydrolysing)
MCGINGILSLDSTVDFSKTGSTRLLLEVMNAALAHRGPDAEGIVVRDRIGLGFRRLSIIDLSSAANQPMSDQGEDITIVFNGEIYNYTELRKDLIGKGHRFRTHSDTEVALRSYIEFGTRCVEKFNGMWAFAIYDHRRERLFCSRDRLGVKPFYYCQQNDCLLFSSELKALHKVANISRANRGKVFEYLVYGYRVNDGETFFEGVNELLPGTNLLVENGRIRLHKYWSLQPGMLDLDHSQDPLEVFVDLFESAVKLRYRSDVPVALLLSGGLDSSSIARVTDHLIERGDLEQNQIHAFIASFPNYDYDETPVAQSFVQGCRHITLNEMRIDSKRIIEGFENTIYGLDHPVYSFATIAHNNIMKACQKEGIKVVLNGQGSDEAFAGYDRYISGAFLLDCLLDKGGKFFVELQALRRRNQYPLVFLLAQMAKSVANQKLTAIMRAGLLERSLSCIPFGYIRENFARFKPIYSFSIRGENLNNYLLNMINHHGLNHILQYEDISSMLQSIEIRSPFLDYRLMEFAFSIPTELKFSMGQTKRIVRETIGRELPDEIAHNPKKIGFRTPFSDYLARDDAFRGYVTDLLNSRSFKEKGIWRQQRVAKRLRNPQSYGSFPFWRIVNLEVWSRVYGVSNL